MPGLPGSGTSDPAPRMGDLAPQFKKKLNLGPLIMRSGTLYFQIKNLRLVDDPPPPARQVWGEGPEIL